MGQWCQSYFINESILTVSMLGKVGMLGQVILLDNTLIQIKN